MQPIAQTSQATELVQCFPQLRVLVIGDAMLDTYLEGHTSHLGLEEPVSILCQTTEHHLPGGAANTAANVRSLGAHVDFLGMVGPDTAGLWLRTALRKYSISDQWLVENASS